MGASWSVSERVDIDVDGRGHQPGGRVDAVELHGDQHTTGRRLLIGVTLEGPAAAVIEVGQQQHDVGNGEDDDAGHPAPARRLRDDAGQPRSDHRVHLDHAHIVDGRPGDSGIAGNSVVAARILDEGGQADRQPTASATITHSVTSTSTHNPARQR